MTDKVLEITNLLKVYGSSGFMPGFRPKYEVLPSVDRVSFSLHKGETLGLIGESGSGKTTLGKSIIKLTDINEGNIKLFGQDVTSLPERKFRHLRRDIQMIFQDLDAALNPNMQVHKILAEILLRYEKISKKDLSKRIEQLILEVNLNIDTLGKLPTELSGGQKRRIAIAAVLAIKPKIIIADEPTTGLDSYTQTIVMQLISDLQKKRGLSVILISHDLQLVKQSCQRIAVLYLGDIVEIGNADQIIDHPAHPYTQLLWNSHLSQTAGVKTHNRRHDIRSGLHDFARPAKGCRFAPRCEKYLKMGKPIECTNADSKPKLNDIRKNHQAACHFLVE